MLKLSVNFSEFHRLIHVVLAAQVELALDLLHPVYKLLSLLLHLDYLLFIAGVRLDHLLSLFLIILYVPLPLFLLLLQLVNSLLAHSYSLDGLFQSFLQFNDYGFMLSLPLLHHLLEPFYLLVGSLTQASFSVDLTAQVLQREQLCRLRQEFGLQLGEVMLEP